METAIVTANDGRFIFTVKVEFIKKFNITDGDTYELMTRYNLKDYLHNPLGPAVVDTQYGTQQWWIDGKPVNIEDIEKIKHTANFNNEMNGILNE